MKNSCLPQKKKSLLLKHAGLFDDPYEWCLLERIYFACNTTPNRKWVCRFSYLMDHTPIKQNKTLTATLKRLHTKGFVEKVEFGKPIGKKLTQRFQYTAAQKTIDELIEKMVKKGPVISDQGSSHLTGTSPVISPSQSSHLTPYSQEESQLLKEKEESKEKFSVTTFEHTGDDWPVNNNSQCDDPSLFPLSMSQTQDKNSESSHLTGVTDENTGFKLFELACKNLPEDQNSILYKEMREGLAKEYGVNLAVCNFIQNGMPN